MPARIEATTEDSKPPLCPNWPIAYFRSGWAFFIPYLVAYLLYAWLRWPVNPVNSTAPGPHTALAVPALLHLYWTLHLGHLVLGALALRVWWQSMGPATRQPSHGTPWDERLWPLLPWLLLALVFWLPGLYLEWPSDPWEHLARINQWSWQDIVTRHTTKWKWSYFFAYSVSGSSEGPIEQIRWLGLYATGISVLLCWQYYRLARAVQLGAKASFCFVLIVALSLGNSTFSFYRYYELSSSIFAQIAAVALTRCFLEYFATKTAERGLVRQLPRLLIAASLLSGLIVYNHSQAIGIAGLGVVAVVIWQLVEKGSRHRWALLLLTGVASALVVICLPSLRLLSRFQEGESPWLTSWYAFNLFSPESPAFERTLLILGLTGVFDLAAALFLLRRNHVAGWLVLTPVLALSLPAFAAPFALQLVTSGQNLIVFHRMLFAIPAGLALVTLGSEYLTKPRSSDHRPFRWQAWLLPLGFTALLALSPGAPTFSRLYNILFRPPADLSMRHLFASAGSPVSSDGSARHKTYLAPSGMTFVKYATGYQHVAFEFPNRMRKRSAIDRLLPAAELFATSDSQVSPVVFAYPDPTTLFTTASYTGYLSNHWLQQEVPIEHAGGKELGSQAQSITP